MMDKNDYSLSEGKLIVETKQILTSVTKIISDQVKCKISKADFPGKETFSI